jgi:predicted dehydrogenase/aryl-alcohol dehydrogenase-like predicted oxidoreductase
MASDKVLRWGILGAGGIAGSFARDLPSSEYGRLAAVGSRSLEKAAGFIARLKGDTAGIRAYGSYEELLADKTIDAVYVATPHPMHAQWAIAAMNAGKHVLCEKPMALHAYDVEAMQAAAEANRVVLLEAYMYRCHPQTVKLVEMIAAGAIGELRMIQAAFGFHWPKPFNAESRLTNNALGGGGILDVGGYPVSLARLLAGAATGKRFADPVEVKGAGHLESTGVDGYTAAVLKFPGDIVAQVSTGVQLNQENVARIYGTDGWILVSHPWGLGGDERGLKMTLHKGGKAEEIVTKADKGLYAYEADALAEAVRSGEEVPAPAMSPADSLGQARTLDQWRKQVGVRYVQETRDGMPPPLPRPRRSGGITIPAGEVPYVGMPVSKLIIGAMMSAGEPGHAAVLFDAYLAAGGNCIDTAKVYGSDKSVGAYLRTRGNRKETALIVKGAHTPYCTPEHLTRELNESLTDLGTDYADIYIMHRDNPAVPVGEFVEVLNEHVRSGRIKAFGGSNWSIARFEEANAYAAKHGKQPFTILNNNFSLARMVVGVWDGCIAASDPESRAWLERTQTTHFAWSSQARGFFVRGDPGFRSDWELTRSWYCDDNFERLRRARLVSEKLGVTANNVALAYCLGQPFPNFCLIGPMNLGELQTTLPALKVPITPALRAYLNLETEAWSG